MASCLQKSRILIGLSTTHAVSYVERAGLSETAVATNLHGRSRPLSSARQMSVRTTLHAAVACGPRSMRQSRTSVAVLHAAVA